MATINPYEMQFDDDDDEFGAHHADDVADSAPMAALAGSPAAVAVVSVTHDDDDDNDDGHNKQYSNAQTHKVVFPMTFEDAPPPLAAEQHHRHSDTQTPALLPSFAATAPPTSSNRFFDNEATVDFGGAVSSTAAANVAPRLKELMKAADEQEREQRLRNVTLAEEAIKALGSLGGGSGVPTGLMMQGRGGGMSDDIHDVLVEGTEMKTFADDSPIMAGAYAPAGAAGESSAAAAAAAGAATNGDGSETITRTAKQPRRDLSWAELLALNAFWYGYTVFGFLILIVAVPSQIRDIVGDENKGFGLFILFVVGGVVNFVASIFLGYASDHVYSRFGRRYSWIVAGSVLLVPTSFLLAAQLNLESYVLAYAILTILNVVVSVPFTGLFADIVNSNQRGRGSAVMGAISQLGAMSGAVLGLFYTSLGTYGAYGVIIGFYMVCLFITIFLVREPPFTQEDLAKMRRVEAVHRDKLMAGDPAGAPRSTITGKISYAWRWTYATILFPLFEPMIVNVDFRWVFFIRLLMQLGQYTVQEFLQYFLSNCVELPEWDGEPMSPETAVSIVILPMLVFATISALIGGIISDKLGGRRRVLMYASGSIMTVVFISLVFVRTFVLAAVAGGALGVGFGAFLAVDFAMVMDILPSKDDFARDVALWSTALILGQVLATPLAGVLLDAFQSIGNDNGIECLGYTVIWIVAAIYVLLATLFVRQVKGIK